MLDVDPSPTSIVELSLEEFNNSVLGLGMKVELIWPLT